MRRWPIVLAILAAVLGVGYWYFTPEPLADLDAVRTVGIKQPAKDDGDAEPCDVIEPLVVDDAARRQADWTDAAMVELDALQRVQAELDTPAPPRFDAVRHMPYADENAVSVAPSFSPAIHATLGTVARTNPMKRSQPRVQFVSPTQPVDLDWIYRIPPDYWPPLNLPVPPYGEYTDRARDSER
jgi:hypothetical protein